MANEGLDRNGIRGIASTFAGILIAGVILLLCAGRLDWANAWVYLGVAFIYQVIYVVVLVRVNPRMLNERGRFVKQGTKPFDLVYVALYLPLSFAGVAVMGLDAGRYGWSSMPWALSAAGVAVFVAACLLGLLAMAVNPFFECTVRIQEDREQRVITAGPYGIIRHPGYAALILSLLAAPFILGSWWGLAPMGFLAVAVVIRTALEDRTLRRELPGYDEYAQSTRYRLAPPLW